MPAQKEKNQSHDSSRGEGIRRGSGKNNFRGLGRCNQGEGLDIHYVYCGKNGHEENTCRIPWEKIKYKQDIKEDKGKASYLEKFKAPKSTHYIVSHFNIGVIEDLFNT